MTFHLVQLFSKHATRFEVQHTLIAGADEEQVKTHTKIQCCSDLRSMEVSSKENNTSCVMFTCGWLSLRFHIARSRVSPRWYCAHNTLGLSTCMFLYVCKSVTQCSVSSVWRKTSENTRLELPAHWTNRVNKLCCQYCDLSATSTTASVTEIFFLKLRCKTVLGEVKVDQGRLTGSPCSSLLPMAPCRIKQISSPFSLILLFFRFSKFMSSGWGI